jgi:hypothetical protein
MAFSRLFRTLTLAEIFNIGGQPDIGDGERVIVKLKGLEGDSIISLERFLPL